MPLEPEKTPLLISWSRLETSGQIGVELIQSAMSQGDGGHDERGSRIF